jgi:hypothetical protein
VQASDGPAAFQSAGCGKRRKAPKEATMIDRPVSPPPSPSAGQTPTLDADCWQAAQERVLRYLKALGVPPLESLEMTLQVLARAASGAQTGATLEPVGAAMRALHQLLEDKWADLVQPSASLPADAPGIPVVARRQLKAYGHVQAAPPLRRGVMRSGQVKP